MTIHYKCLIYYIQVPQFYKGFYASEVGHSLLQLAPTLQFPTVAVVELINN